MCGVCKEGSDLALGVVGRSNSTEAGVRVQCLEEHRTRVEVLAGASGTCLINYTVEEFRCYDVGNGDIVSGRWRVARALLASGTTIIVSGATKPKSAAAEIRCAATIMGLLDKLWDDTVAGPRPENGLSKLRKYSTFNSRQNLRKESDRSYGDDMSDDGARVTRSIMIVKPPGIPSPGPSSPASTGSTPPVSPFAAGRDRNRFRRKSSSDAFERPERTGSRVPSPPFEV